MSDIDPELLLKTADPVVHAYADELKSQNLKLQKQIIKHQAEAVTYQNRITALEEAIKESQKPNPHLNIYLSAPPEQPKKV